MSRKKTKTFGEAVSKSIYNGLKSNPDWLTGNEVWRTYKLKYSQLIKMTKSGLLSIKKVGKSRNSPVFYNRKNIESIIGKQEIEKVQVGKPIQSTNKFHQIVNVLQSVAEQLEEISEQKESIENDRLKIAILAAAIRKCAQRI